MKPTTVFLGIFAFIFFWLMIPLLLLQLNVFLGLPVFESGYLIFFGICFFFADAFIFAYCNNLFMKFGKGTFMPTESTKKFVDRGLYRYIRNPIYAGHILCFFGIFLVFGHILFLAYTIFMFIGISVMVVLLEEPDLRKKFGKSYVDYTRRVKRWGFF